MEQLQNPRVGSSMLLNRNPPLHIPAPQPLWAFVPGLEGAFEQL